jgi:hypothetical protein
MLSGQRTRFAPYLAPGRLDPDALRSLSRQWDAQHRRLFIVAGSGQTVSKLFPGHPMRIVHVVRNVHQLVQTLVTRPGAYQEERLTFAIARVPRQ